MGRLVGDLAGASPKPKFWVAAEGHETTGSAVLPGLRVAVHGEPGASSDEVSAWTVGFSAPDRFTNFSSDEIGRPTIPPPLAGDSIRCGRQLDFLGLHRAACAEAGILANRGLGRAAAQVCREAGARVSTNVREGHGPCTLQSGCGRFESL